MPGKHVGKTMPPDHAGITGCATARGHGSGPAPHHGVMAKIGYARVSTRGQNDDSQADDLTAYGCEKIFTDTASGKNAARPELDKALAYLRRRRLRHHPAVPRDAVPQAPARAG